jgi:hypothetical protein
VAAAAVDRAEEAGPPSAGAGVCAGAGGGIGADGGCRDGS